MFFDNHNRQGCGGCGQSQSQSQPIQPRYSIPVPGLQDPIGAGSLVKGILSHLGMQPCSGCQQRAEGMNRAVGFRPVGWV